MRIKRKNGLKVAAITIALLLCLALAVGITGAWYQAKRQATGTLSMDQGIIIDYKGFGKTPDEGIWTRETTTTFLLFDKTDAQPGQNIPVKTAGIRANAKSVNFYARVKLSYKFYNGETLLYDSTATTGNVANFKPSDLIKTSAKFFGDKWVESGDGYYYYAADTTLNKFNKGTQTFVDLFAADAKFIIEGAGFKGATSDGEGGGFVVDGTTTSINKIEVYLTLETLQGDATAEQAKALGWEIEPMPVIEDFSENRLLNKNGDVLDPKNTELVENTIYQVVDAQGNGYKFTYALNEANKTATITGPVGKPKELDIPSKIIVKGQDYTTTSIGIRAFQNCSSLTSITMPNSVTSIGSWAFGYCISLTSVTIGSGVTTIEGSAFWKCNRLKSVEIPDSVTSIGENAFADCSGLKSVTIGNSVKSIGNRAFSSTALTSITIPDSVTSIGNNAFYWCNSLTSMHIGAGIQKINWLPGNLSSITISKNNPSFVTDRKAIFEKLNEELSVVKYISADTTYEILSMVDGLSVTSIGPWAFRACSGITSITIPDSVTSIGQNAFEDCSGLTSITIPNSVTSIGYRAFSGCTGLTSVTIDSATIAGLGSSDSNLLDNATKVYVKSDIKTVGSYITGPFDKAASSDKAGYDMYTKKA